MQKSEIWQHVFCRHPTPIQQVDDYKGVTIMVKRDDLNHEVIQGNKLRKLKYNLKFALENGYDQLATFGGAYSNHLIATAQAANLVGLTSLGFIRGEELANQQGKWSATLKNAHHLGMTLVFLTRADYKKKDYSDTVQKSLSKATYLIPEGGSNSLAIAGVSEIISELNNQLPEPTHIITACGTAGTLSGLVDGIAQNNWQTKIIGIPVLKAAAFLNNDIKNLSRHHANVNWELYLDYHAGGYAKTNNATINFAKEFSLKQSIPLDKVYTSKSFFAAYDLIRKGEIAKNSTVVILHTGGLQGGLV